MAGRKCAPFLALFAALVGASVGCSLLVDTSGFSGEAPTSPSEAGTTDAADAADATAVDASTDASTPMDAEAGFVCDATFCDGFDDGPLGARWDTKDLGVQATLALTPAAFSAPSALELDMPARSPTAAERHAFLSKTLAASAGTVTCRFRANIVRLPVGGDFAIFRLDPLPTTKNQTFEMKSTPNGSLTVYENYTEDGGSFENPTALGTVTAGQWVLVEVSADFKASTMSAAVNGTRTVITMSPTSGVTGVRLNLGETGDSDLGHFTGRVDDFECSAN